MASRLEAEFSSQDVSSLLKKTLETVARTFRAGTGALLLKDLETEALVLEASIGMGLEEYGVSIHVGQGFSGYVAKTGQPQIVLDTTLDERIISPTLRRQAKTLWGVVTRVQAKLTAHTLGVYLNTLLSRPPLALKTLVA